MKKQLLVISLRAALAVSGLTPSFAGHALAGAPAAPAATSNSSGFEKGVALTDFIKYWGENTSGVNSDFNDMTGGNLNWARFELYQSNPLSFFDTAVQSAQSRHIKLLVIAENTYPYRDLGSDTDRANFKSWLAQMVNRYKYYVKHWEIGNEENLHYEWNIDDSSTSDQTKYQASAYRYVLHLQDAYQTIKANDATATVFIGGLSEWTVERYMDALMNENVCPYFDVWSFHPFGSDPNRVLG